MVPGTDSRAVCNIDYTCRIRPPSSKPNSNMCSLKIVNVVLQIPWKEDSSENRSALLDNKNIKVEFPVYDVNDLICLNRVPR